LLEEQVPEQLNDNAGNGGPEVRDSQPVFTRPMPGGGSVRVELLVSDRGDVTRERLRGRVVMDFHSKTSVVVEELEGDDADDVVPELLRIARDNAAIARRVMRQRASLRAD